MKKILKHCLILGLLASLFAACEKDEHQIYYEGGTSPVLTSTVITPDLPLSYANRDNEAIGLSWTNPNYKFTTGISSQDVNYQVEIDTAGAEFKSPKKQSVAISKDLNKSFTVSEFNGFLLNQLRFNTANNQNIEIRVKSYLGGSSIPLYSNVLQYVVKPYAIPPVVAPPTTGKLYLVGDATAGGWDNPVPAPQEFTQIDSLNYEITVDLVGGKEYLFLPLNGNWDHKFACKDKTKQSADGGDFGYDFNDNFPGPAAGGNYKIKVDFQRGKYTVTRL